MNNQDTIKHAILIHCGTCRVGIQALTELLGRNTPDDVQMLMYAALLGLYKAGRDDWHAGGWPRLVEHLNSNPGSQIAIGLFVLLPGGELQERDALTLRGWVETAAAAAELLQEFRTRLADAIGTQAQLTFQQWTDLCKD